MEKHLRYYFLLTLGILLSFAGRYYPQQNINNKIDKVLYQTYNSQFDEALKIIDRELAIDPVSLQWTYFKGMALYRKWLQAKVFARKPEDEKEREQLFHNSLAEFQKLVNNGETILKKNSGDTTALFYTGAAYGYIGIYYAKKGELLKAASEGKKGMDLHDKLIKRCPNWTDVYISLGIFNLYASDAPWYVKPILWIFGKSGSEEKASYYLKMVSYKGHLAKFEAMEMLLELSMRRKDFTSATELFKDLINNFPNSKYYYMANLAFLSWEYDCRDYGITMMNECIHNISESQINEKQKVQVGCIYVLLANSYWMNKNTAKGIEYWKELLKKNYLSDEEEWLKLVLANTYLKNGNKTEAEKLYKEISQSPKESHSKQEARKALLKLTAN